VVTAIITGLGASAYALVSIATASTPAAVKGTEHFSIVTTSISSPAAP
jgi:hypothetical protein